MKSVYNLKKISREVRLDIVDQIYHSQIGNIGGSLSCVELLVYLYKQYLKINEKNLNSKKRDKFILSKGQAAPAYYSILSKMRFIPRKELKTFRQIDSRLQTHPEYGKLKCIDFSSGSLGQGLSVGVGMAIAEKLKKFNNRIVVMVGDGEMQEGQIWEAIISASHFKLNNLILIIDNNKLQDGGFTKDVMGIENLNEKLSSFKWNTISFDGHKFEEINNAFKSISHERPNCLIANTIKGKGISFMENSKDYHMIGKMNEALYKRCAKAILNAK